MIYYYYIIGNKAEELPEGIFPINGITIKKYKWSEPSIIAKYKYGTYHKGSFRGGSDIDLKLIRCKDNIVIKSKLQV